MDKINIVKLSTMVQDFLKENEIETPIGDFTIEGNSLGFKFEHDNIEIIVKREIGMTIGSTSESDRYKYRIILNNKSEKVFG